MSMEELKLTVEHDDDDSEEKRWMKNTVRTLIFHIEHDERKEAERPHIGRGHLLGERYTIVNVISAKMLHYVWQMCGQLLLSKPWTAKEEIADFIILRKVIFDL